MWRDNSTGSMPSLCSSVTCAIQGVLLERAPRPGDLPDSESVVFDAGNTMLNLLVARKAVELISPARVAAPGDRSRSLFSFFFFFVDDVDDVDDEGARLTDAGVNLLNGPIDRPWGKRTAAFADPDGTVWEVAQDLPR